MLGLPELGFWAADGFIWLVLLIVLLWALGAIVFTPWCLYNLWKHSPDSRDFWYHAPRTFVFGLIWPYTLYRLFH